MMRKMIVMAALVLVMAGAAAGIWKVNQKVNSLSETVAQMQQARHLTAAEDRCGYIPDLVPARDGWKVTQFGDVSQMQEMCYTITTNTGLVIVDGGWEYEEPRLRNIIAQYGNSVEAWILTHPHSDHMSAFLNIYEDPQGIQIHRVYMAEFPDYDTLKANAPWDDYSTLERFRSLEIPQLEYLHTGDERDILGLKMKVLSACSDQVDELSSDLLNDGSMMFRVSGKRDSMLFCADVGKSLTNWLVEEYGAGLKSDYIQMGHHGYGGPDAAFYEAAEPKAVFFDAPHSLMSGEFEKSTVEKGELVRDMGCVIYSYYTAPNQILLE